MYADCFKKTVCALEIIQSGKQNSIYLDISKPKATESFSCDKFAKFEIPNGQGVDGNSCPMSKNIVSRLYVA